MQYCYLIIKLQVESNISLELYQKAFIGLYSINN